jgi:NADPH2:quinone reductase
MRAAMITTLSGPDGVEVREVREPAPSRDEVLIDVSYASVSFPDLLQTRGEYQQHPDLPFIAGWEVTGIVRADVGQFRAGDRVAAMPMLGGWAETVAVREDRVFPLPADVPLDKGAALPLNYLTAHFALTRRTRLTSGERVLVHGAAGGVGTAACQLARAYGAVVIAVVSSAEKERIAEAAGAHEIVLVDGFRDAVRHLTEGSGVDVIVDPVGGDRFLDSLRSLASEGRLLVLGFTSGTIPTAKVNRLLLGNTAVIGVGSAELWRREPGYLRQQWDELIPLIESRAIDPVVGRVFPLEDVAAAIREMDQRRAVGKVLIRLC